MLRIIYGKDTAKHPDLMQKVYRFRHQIFVEEKGWRDLERPDGEERDDFDTDATVHQIIVADGQVVGYQRLIPTIGPHLLSTVLSSLCIEPTPCGPTVYEWTRFCLESSRRETFPRRNAAFLFLAQSVVEWGLANGITTTTVVIDCRLVVIGMQLRFRVKPLGFPQKIGREEVVALELSFNAETLEAIHAARSSWEPIISPSELYLPAASEGRS